MEQQTTGVGGWRLLGVILVFALLGPPLGWWMTGLAGGGLAGLATAMLLTLTIFPVIFSYLIGGLAALAAGCAAAFAARFKRVWIYLLAPAVVGGAVAVAPAVLVSERPVTPQAVLLLTAAAVLSSLICGLLTTRLAGLSLPSMARVIPPRLRGLHAGYVLLIVLGLLSVGLVATWFMPAAGS
jgi:hypothetical protein